MSAIVPHARTLIAESRSQSPAERTAIEQALCGLMELLLTDIERLEAHVADLQSGMFVNCVYCGHRYGPQMTTPVTMADALKEHIAQCPEHPMAQCVVMLKTASLALKSYAGGYAETEMAAVTARTCDLVIAKATGGPA